MERPTKKLANFLDLHSAELVDNLTSNQIRPLLSHLFRICRHNPELSTKFDHLASDRDLAISLLKLLPKEDLSFYLAFLDALLHSGNFGLFCKFIGLHLIDSSRFEQFAKTYDDRPFFAPSNCELPNEENDFNSASIDFDHRREFVERHAELLRMKLKNSSELMEMMGKWAGINHFGEGENECQKVINILVDPNQPIHSFESFCLALIVSRQFRIFRQIWGFHWGNPLTNLEWMEKCWKHFIEIGQKEEELKEEEIEEWMIDEDSSQIRVENVDSSFAGGDGTFFDMMAYYRENKNEIYRNFSSPRGLALIINNFHFQNRDKRDGSQVDVVKITNLLQQLNYKVQSKNDLTAEQILWAMSDFATHPEHQRMDSAIVVLMSHGEHDVIMGTDDGKVNVHDLLRSLNQNAPGLRGKPKIFIVQACRGIEMDEGIQRPLRLDEGTDANDGAGGGPSSFWSSLFSSKSKKNANNGRINMSMGGLFRANPPPPSPKQREQHFVRKLSIQSVNEPTEVDVLIAYPTTPYYVSWRNSSSGSWFVQSLCEVFSKWAKKEDLLSMLTRVNNLVAKRETNCPKRFKQTPEQVNRLRKKFYFFPGVHNFHED